MELARTGGLRGHRADVVGLCPDATGDAALSSSEDGFVRLWDTRCHRAVRAVHAQEGSSNGPPSQASDAGGALGSCAFLDPTQPGGPVLVAAGSSLLLYDLRASDQVIVRAAPDASARAGDDINDFAVSPDGRLVAVPSDLGDVTIVSAADLTPQRTLAGGHTNIAGSARFRGGGAELFTGGFDQVLAFWDPHKGKLKQRCEVQQLLPEEEPSEGRAQVCNPAFVMGLAVGPRDELAVGLGNGALLALPGDWRPHRGEAPWCAPAAHASQVVSVSWLFGATAASRRKAPILASAGSDCAVHLWSVEFPTRRRPGSVQVSEPLASVRLPEKVNALACASEARLLVADTTNEISVLQVRQ